MTPRLIGSSHVTAMSGSFEMDKDGSLVRVMTVETDLKLNALDPAYDAEAVDELLGSVQESMGDLYDRADLKQAEPNA